MQEIAKLLLHLFFPLEFVYGDHKIPSSILREQKIT